MQTSYAEQLRQVRDSLTPDNWNKGSYFANKNRQLCMCVHGAGQALVNPQVKKALEKSKVATARIVAAPANAAARRSSTHSARASGARSARDGFHARHDRGTNKDLLSVWENRPALVKNDYIFNTLNYGNTNIHYLMGMFGITATFNDSPSTTLEMLKNKLSEAAKWAEENEEFLQNN